MFKFSSLCYNRNATRVLHLHTWYQLNSLITRTCITSFSKNKSTHKYKHGGQLQNFSNKKHTYPIMVTVPTPHSTAFTQPWWTIEWDGDVGVGRHVCAVFVVHCKKLCHGGDWAKIRTRFDVVVAGFLAGNKWKFGFVLFMYEVIAV